VSGRRKFLNPDPLGFGGGLNFYAYANGNPVSYLDPFGLFSWGKIAQGSGEVILGVGGLIVGGLLEAPSVGTSTAIGVGGYLMITHGLVEFGTGLQPTLTTPQQQQFLDVYPSGPGQLIGMAGYAFGPSVGQKTETIGGLVWDVGSLGGSTFGVLNSFANGEKMALPLTQLGLDSASLFSSAGDTAQMFFGTPGQVPNINDNSNPFNLSQPVDAPSPGNSSWLSPTPTTSNQSSSTGK